MNTAHTGMVFGGTVCLFILIVDSLVETEVRDDMHQKVPCHSQFGDVTITVHGQRLKPLSHQDTQHNLSPNSVTAHVSVQPILKSNRTSFM